jgi:hypothetical protein
MMKMSLHRSAVERLALLWSVQLAAQQTPKIPIRTLAPSTAVSTIVVGPVLAVRALSNGNILVNDPREPARVVVRRHARTLASRDRHQRRHGPDAPAKVATAGCDAHSLFRRFDALSRSVAQSLWVLDANGKVARVMSIPRPATSG